MKIDRRRFLLAAGAATLATSLPARADALDDIRSKGSLRVAVYNNFAPYSNQGKGIDVELAEALGKHLGLATQVVGYNADEDMDDDLRNMVWKGHYLGAQPSDVMMHVPVDSYLQGKNDKVKIFGPYHLETIAVARIQRIGPIRGSAATALEVFTREKIGVEGRSLADAFLLGVLNGRLRENVMHFTSVAGAIDKMKAGEIAAVMGPRSEIEVALGKDPRFVIEAVQMPELKINNWPLGMAVKAEENTLAETLAGALRELQRNGTVAAIFARHGVTYLQPTL
ncbi:MAG: transporter substrate-binding domain-containing protein [Zoogloea oleivorans]|uniref:Transporter substrate-binding domain-containing protein n=1 Tax=Zoogloea oleivorans TaxID=1552750 RepID=A0A6C2CM18_9RHOO|nr:transporter substrate-binding domain-containing protein [Zoogloea oleivorans]MBT9496210.1 transporter substrate-binding domain-containing protein [Zoogloea sp.]MDY0036325.1 transporter substrate-binding domain-containing protein [Zoogloea oleivorans]TYC55078.1 transporter substrate-binding domain-containing protein [Zoogloea oleivorans]